LRKGILALIADLGADGMTMVVESGPPAQIFETAETDRLRRFLSQVL
jgi:polar amino acid transport system ATP-binding protein